MDGGGEGRQTMAETKKEGQTDTGAQEGALLLCASLPSKPYGCPVPHK